MGRAYGKRGREEKCKQKFSRETWEENTALKTKA
jgi:hypothetical protein